MADEPIVVDTAADPELTVEVQHEASGEGVPQLTDEEVEKLAEPPADDEVGRYAKEAQRRIKNLRTAGQEWRRRVVQANKDLATATSLAEQLYRENQQLKGTVNRSESALVEQAVQRVTAELERAKERALAAHAANNGPEIVAASEQLARCAAELDRLRLLRPPSAAGGAPEGAPAGTGPAAPPPPPPQSQESEGLREWRKRNPWFQREGEEEMTAFAFGVDKRLQAQGITEATNPEAYWGAIDRRMREKFPEKFPADKSRPAEAPPDGRRPVAVTGSTRVNGGAAGAPARSNPRHVTLTDSQVRLAKSLGLTAEQYAAQLVKEGKVS